MTNSNGSGWGWNVGQAVKAGGPWTLALIALVGVLWLTLFPSARADPFTGSDARAALTVADARFNALEKSMADLATCLQRHIESAMHTGTHEALAQMRADVTVIRAAVERIEKRMDATGR